MTRGVRIAAALGGLALAVLLVLTITLLLAEYIGGQTAMSQEEYTQTRWTPGADK